MATGFGFRISKADSCPQEMVTCVKLVGDSVRLGKGDPVKLATGSINIGSGPIVQAVARAASGDRVWGVVEGVDQISVTSGLSLDRTYSPASTANYILVRRVFSGQQWDVQEDALGGSVPTTSVGNNITMIAADCSTDTGMSGYMADSSTAATTNTLDLCITGFASRANNVPGSAAVLTVTFNKVQTIDQTTGV